MRCAEQEVIFVNELLCPCTLSTRADQRILYAVAHPLDADRVGDSSACFDPVDGTFNRNDFSQRL